MVAIVVVSHSAALAASVIEFVRAMGGDKAPMEAAGGVEDGIGTDFELIGAAIERAREASGGDGVLVLMDLGSAVQTAQMVLELGGMDESDVRLVAAPLVEGALAAAINAGGGGSLDEVAREARGALRAKQEELGESSAEPPVPVASSSQGDGLADSPVDVDVELPVRNRLGLHARPAAKLVGLAMEHDAELLLSNATTGRGPVSARSLSDIALLGVRGGHVLRVQARGAQADEVVQAVRELADTGFGDGVEASPSVAVASQGDARAGPAVRTEAPAEPPAPGTLLHGVPASPGLADGPLHRIGGAPAIPSEDADDPDAELARLDEALTRARADLEAARDDLAGRGRAGEAAIFDAQAALLGDAALLGPAREAVAAGRNAARAVHDAAEALAARYEQLEDDYLRERAADVRDVGRRIVRALLGEGTAAAGAGQVLVTDELLPGDAALLDPERVAGVATAHGGATGHAAIIARSLGVPTVVGLGPALLAVPAGTRLLLDGEAGTVLVDPDPQVAAEHAARVAAAAERRERALRAAAEPAVTRDGTAIEVVANLGDVAGGEQAVALGAEGVGLLRTEFLFLDRNELPSEDEQADAYGRIARDLGGRPLIIRTLDVGADKPLRALPQEPEANPFLGRRGIRLQLAMPELLTSQLRAILRTADAHPGVKVMFPMVSTLEEVRAVRAALGEAKAALGVDPPLEVGIMVEVPAVAVQAERFAAELDFLSIGTNDLAQYTMAAERGNEHVAALAAGPVPAVLRLIDLTVRGAQGRDCWVGVCGELAGDVDSARLLVGLGVTELSMAPPRIAEVKEALRALDLGRAREAAQRAMRADTPAQARAISAEIGP